MWKLVGAVAVAAICLALAPASQAHPAPARTVPIKVRVLLPNGTPARYASVGIHCSENGARIDPCGCGSRRHVVRIPSVDPLGRAQADLPIRTHYFVHAWSEGYHVSAPWRPGATAERLDLVLQPLAHGRLRFVDEDDRPVVGVRASMSWWSTRPGAPRTPSLHGGGLSNFEGHTDADGVLTMPGSHPGVWRPALFTTAVLLPDQHEITAPISADETRIIRCYAPRTLTGQVVDRRGKPVFDAVVRATRNRTLWDRTDRDGRFTIRHLLPGPYRLTAELHGPFPLPRAALRDVEAGLQNLIVRLER